MNQRANRSIFRSNPRKGNTDIPASSMKHHKISKRKNGRCSDHPQAGPTISPREQSKSLVCPICGGWIIVEHSMEFYHRRFLKKCLNCGRILTNPFISEDAPASLTGRRLPPPSPKPVKLDCTFLLRLQNYQKDEI